MVPAVHPFLALFPSPFPPLCCSPPPVSLFSENLENLILTIGQAYVPALKGYDFEAAEPEAFPDVGIWHPLAPNMYEDLKEFLNW